MLFKMFRGRDRQIYTLGLGILLVVCMYLRTKYIQYIHIHTSGTIRDCIRQG